MVHHADEEVYQIGFALTALAELAQGEPKCFAFGPILIDEALGWKYRNHSSRRSRRVYWPMRGDE
jgi:hypothetical protein